MMVLWRDLLHRFKYTSFSSVRNFIVEVFCQATSHHKLDTDFFLTICVHCCLEYNRPSIPILWTHKNVFLWVTTFDVIPQLLKMKIGGLKYYLLRGKPGFDPLDKLVHGSELAKMYNPGILLYTSCIFVTLAPEGGGGVANSEVNLCFEFWKLVGRVRTIWTQQLLWKSSTWLDNRLPMFD